MNDNDLIRLDMPINTKYLGVLGACIREMLSQVEVSDREMTVYGIQLAAHEGCINVIEHAYAGDGGRVVITLSLLAQPTRFVCEIWDMGARSFDPTTVSESDEESERGRGLALVRQLMDEVVYRSRGGSVWQSIAGGPWAAAEPTCCVLPSEGNYWHMAKRL